MQRLLAFIEHNFHFILFIILQIICGFLIFGLNPYQQAVFSHSAASVTARSNQFSTDLTSYIDLKEQNILLQSQVSEQFKNAPNNSFRFLQDTIDVKDSSSRPLFEAIPAQVIYNTTYKANNVFVINKGTDNGIRKNMGVVSSEGVAGIVLRSNAKYSVAMSLLNTDMKIIPNINDQEFFTELVWDNSNPHTMKIMGINKLEKIKEGDLVYTGRSSLLFPPGIPIGSIAKLTPKPNSQYFDTYITTATQFRKLAYVYVIINRDESLIIPLMPDNE